MPTWELSGVYWDDFYEDKRYNFSSRVVSERFNRFLWQSQWIEHCWKFIFMSSIFWLWHVARLTLKIFHSSHFISHSSPPTRGLRNAFFARSFNELDLRCRVVDSSRARRVRWIFFFSTKIWTSWNFHQKILLLPFDLKSKFSPICCWVLLSLSSQYLYLKLIPSSVCGVIKNSLCIGLHQPQV